MSSIGDVTHALPVVEAIKRRQPDLFVGWVVRSRCASLLAGNPIIDRVHVVGEKTTIAELSRLGRELRQEHYDTAMDMQGLFVSGLVTWLSRAKRRIGLDSNREGNSLFMTETPVEAPDGRHAVDILQGFAKAVGIEDRFDETRPQEYLAEADAVLADTLLDGLSRPKVVLNVGASTVYKQWPVENWTQVAQGLCRSGIGVVLVGGRAEVEQAREVERSITGFAGVRNIAGKTNLRELAAVIAKCDLMVSGDTGPMHIAGIVGTPIVALFGPTHPSRTGPYGRQNQVIWKELACGPCYRHPTCAGRVDCLRAITPDEVLAAVQARVGASVSA